MSNTKRVVTEILLIADIKVGGDRAWDIKVHDDRFYNRVLTEGSMGLGESYMDGWWECEHLDQFIYKILTANVRKKLPINFNLVLSYITSLVINEQDRKRSKKVIDIHYDLGNDLYERMLDKRMVYTCGYWLNAENIDKAQEDKLDLICRKLYLKPGMKVLDIGCGFGSFLKYASEKYGITGVGITLSKEQLNYAVKSCEGLPIEIRLQDYRDLNEKFDAVVSIGMFEAVGYKNFNTYMDIVYKCLSPEGLFLLHTVGSNEPDKDTNNPWIEKYIFPGGVLPTISSIGKSIGNKFVMEDWHNFGTDYDKTLMAWHSNFKKHWPEISSKYGDRFYKMWEFYLLSFAGSFRARNIELWQIVLSKDGLKKRYNSIR